jgi:hypothetical protein
MKSYAIICNQRPSEAIRGHHMQSYAIICNHMQSYAIGGNQRQSEAIRGNPKQSEAIRGNQRQSEAHHAVLMLAAHSVTERVDRPCVLELPEDERDLVLEQRALLLVAETRLTMGISGNPMQSEAIRGNQRQSAAIRDSYSQSGNQRQSEAISGHPRPSEAVTCNQGQSEAIRGNQRQSEAISMPSGFVTLAEARHSQRGSSASSPALGTASRSAKSALYLMRGAIRCNQLAIRRSQLWLQRIAVPDERWLSLGQSEGNHTCNP